MKGQCIPSESKVISGTRSRAPSVLSGFLFVRMGLHTTPGGASLQGILRGTGKAWGKGLMLRYTQQVCQNSEEERRNAQWWGEGKGRHEDLLHQRLTSLGQSDSVRGLEPVSAICWMQQLHRTMEKWIRWQRHLLYTASRRPLVCLTKRSESKGQGYSCLGTGPRSIQQTLMIFFLKPPALI